jgi:hypothetical protein
MADLSLGFVNPNSLIPSGDNFNIGFAPSAYGRSLDMYRADAAKQFIQEQLRRLPLASQVEQGELQNKLALQPQQLQLKQAALAQEYSAIKGKPVAELVDNLADAWPAAAKQNPITQSRIHANIIQDWKNKNPGIQLPPDMDNFNADSTPARWEDAYNMRRFNVQREAQLEQFQIQKQTELQKARITAQANIEAQRGRGAEAAEIRGPSAGGLDKQNIRRLGVLKGTIADLKSTDDQKENSAREAELLLADDIEDKITKRFGNEQATPFMRPEQLQARQQAIKQYRGQLMAAHGLLVKVQRGDEEHMIPWSQLSEAKRQGFQIKK